MSEPFLGTVMIWAPNFAPRGWAFCQGQIMSISTNSALFSLLGVVYGGNGQTTFGLPNLAGRVPVGQGQSAGTSSYVLGQTSGTETVTLTTAQMPMHNHGATVTFTGAPSVSLQASQSQATSEKPDAGSLLADAAPAIGTAAGPKIYVASGDTGDRVTLGGVSGNAGTLAGTVAVAPNGSSQPFTVVQPYQVLNYVIALEGVFPSRN
ncbi:phage tail protein [Indioceanicola profundi]|uniref:phage tail protein n=1 Tax=Indioceanicola profundi TaxID=2220096 RepID=UPI000E6AE193|nr:tail fiber protein [Indioceanicola profundi]